MAQGMGQRFDAVVVGGGFYGVAIADYLARRRGLRRVALVEAETSLCARASYANQARVHNGYHYPRSFTTAYRSRVNFPGFLATWPDAIVRDFTAVYAIARHNSKTTAYQFTRFCRDIGAPLHPAPREMLQLFNGQLIETAYLVEECAFDAGRLAAWATRSLAEVGVEVRLATRAASIARGSAGLQVACDGDRGAELLACDFVFNCTYSGLNQLSGGFPGATTALKHEIVEMGLVEMPPSLRGLGITVMDGPFFSAMPFPARGLHTLSHVRYTPHLHWADGPDLDPTVRLAQYHRQSRVDWMIRDAARYVPAVAKARHVDSLFEVKTVLAKSEGDDGRPILFEHHATLPGCYSILGGKIDNIFDVLEKLDAEPLHAQANESAA
jgi:glycine/D-amino acid oxidase-like deaminating enzyme